MNNICRMVAAACVCLSPLAAADEKFAPPAAIQQKIQAGQDRYQKGDQSGALEKLKEAAEEAKNPDVVAPQITKQVQAELAIKRGQFLMAPKQGAAELQAALDEFQSVIEKGTDQQKALAHVNTAAVYMRLGKPKEAAEWILKADWDKIDEQQRYMLHYNAGRALQDSGNSKDAFDRYISTLRWNPYYQPAADRAVQTALKLATSETATVELGRRLNHAHRPQQACDFALQLLGNNPGKVMPQTLGSQQVLLETWAAEFTTPENFQKQYSGTLESLMGKGWRSFASDVQAAAVKPIAWTRSDRYGIPQREFPYLTKQESPGLQIASGRFLATTAQQILASASAGKEPSLPRGTAYARLYAAHRISRSDISLCTALVRLCRDEKGFDDPDGNIRQEIIGHIFQEKTFAYQKKPTTESEWQRLLVLHSALGEIYEEEKRWGSVGDVQSALFQWKHAVDAEREVNKLRAQQDKAPIHAPAAYQHLGNVYAALKLNENAADNCLIAAELYIAQGDIGPALLCLDAVEPIAKTAEQKAKWSALRQKIESRAKK